MTSTTYNYYDGSEAPELVVSSTTSSSTTRKYNSADMIATEDYAEEITVKLERIWRRRLPASTEALFAQCVQAGMQLALIDYAADETARAPYPSPRYTEAILQRLLREGIKEESQLYQDRTTSSRRGGWASRR